MHIGILTEGSIILILVEPETYSKILMAFVVNYEINLVVPRYIEYSFKNAKIKKAQLAYDK